MFVNNDNGNSDFLTRPVQLRHICLVEAAENTGVVPGDHLVLGQPETVAARPAVVLVPAVRAVEGVLGQDGAKEGQRDQISHLEARQSCSGQLSYLNTLL